MELWILLLVIAAVMVALRHLRRRGATTPPPATPKMERAVPAESREEEVSVAAEIMVSKSDSPLPGTVMPVEVLKQFEPLNLWTEEELTVLAMEHPSLIYPPESILFRRGEPVLWGYYLLRGAVDIVPTNGAVFALNAQDEQARFPLGCGEHYQTDCLTRSQVEVLRLPREIALASGMAAKRHAMGIDTAAMNLPPVLKGSSAFYVFCQTFESRQVSLPTLPSVALKLREALRAKDLNLEAAAKIVQIDPVTTAKLIQVANSPLYFASKRIATCHSAMVRLGLDATLNLIVSIGLRGLFRSKNAHINRLMSDIWQKSVQVSVLASMLARELGTIEPDHALLAGLTYRIGAIPFLSFVDHLPRENYTAEEIDAAIPLLAGPVGKLVLTEWDFAEEYLDLPLLAEDWFAETAGGFGLSDLLRLAVWHSYMGEPRAKQLPPIFSLPSFAKLKRAELTPEFSLTLLQKAKAQIDETTKVLVH